MRSFALIGGGSFVEPKKFFNIIQSCDEVIAIDSGLRYCHELGIRPHLILGDMDSVDPQLLELYAGVPLKQFSCDKSESDLELALSHAIAMKPEKIHLFGATGNRTDHTFSNLYLLERYPEQVVIHGDHETIFCLCGKQSVATVRGQTVSLLPFCGEAKGVSTTGLKWELKNATLDNSFFSLSNIALGEHFEIEIARGSVICFLIYSTNYQLPSLKRTD